MDVSIRGDGFLLQLDVLGYESERRGEGSYDDNWRQGQSRLNSSTACRDL